MTYAPLLPDHQPDILFQGNAYKRLLWTLRNSIAWATEQVCFVARGPYLTDVAGREANLAWMKEMGGFIKHQRRELARAERRDEKE